MKTKGPEIERLKALAEFNNFLKFLCDASNVCQAQSKGKR